MRVLERRIDRWSRACGAEAEAVTAARQAARQVAARLVAEGLVDDAAYAASRARSLGRSGHSRRAVAAHLAGRGIAAEVARAALPDDPAAELTAAVLFTRRRRIGAFGPADGSDPRKALGMLARAGFAREVAEAALRMELDAAEALVLAARQA